MKIHAESPPNSFYAGNDTSPSPKKIPRRYATPPPVPFYPARKRITPKKKEEEKSGDESVRLSSNCWKQKNAAIIVIATNRFVGHASSNISNIRGLGPRRERGIWEGERERNKIGKKMHFPMAVFINNRSRFRRNAKLLYGVSRLKRSVGWLETIWVIEKKS